MDVPRVPRDILRTSDHIRGETSEQVRQRVIVARQRQLDRQGNTNAELNSRNIDINCKISEDDETLLEKAMNRFKLSARAYHRILKIARTIADLDGRDDISTVHLSEALSYTSNGCKLRFFAGPEHR